MKGIIIFKGKYGATRQYALWLGDTLGIPAVMAGNETPSQLDDAGYIILGTSIYIGKLQLRNWISQHAALLKKKKVFLFLVAGTAPSETVKLQGYLDSNIAAEVKARFTCFFLPGKLEFKKLSLADKILLKIGARLSKGSDDAIVISDYNNVQRERLADIISAVEKLKEAVVL